MSKGTERDRLSFLFGCLLVTLPGLSPSGLKIFTAIYIIAKHRSISGLFLRRMMPYILLLLAWIVGYLTAAGDLNSAWIVLEKGGSIIDYLVGTAPPFWITAGDLIRLLVLILLTEIFSRDTTFKMDFLRGVLSGIPAAGVIFILQLTRFAPFNFPNESAFWTGQGRHPATFSDPNACGIFCVLLLPLVFKVVPSFLARVGTIAALLIMGILCGSRSFALGTAIYLTFLLVKSKRKWGVPFLLAVLALPLALDLLGGLPGFTSILTSLPQGLQRIISSISFAHLKESLYSRSVFWRIDLAIWNQHSLLGAGPNSVYGLVTDTAARLGESIGIWTDNANSFYLKVLSETGLVGVGLLVFCLSGVRWRSPDLTPGRVSLSLLLILFLFGPHLDFWEVTVLTAALLADSLIFLSPHPAEKKVLAASCALFPVVIFHLHSLPYGLYPWEKDGALFRWTRDSAAGILYCHPDAELKFQAPLPGGTYPVHTTISFNGESRELTIVNAEPISVALPCDGERELRYEITLDKPWLPQVEIHGSDDPRLLGVRILSPPGH